MKIWIKRTVALLVLIAAAGAFFGLPTHIACRIQPAATWIFLAVLLLTPVFGRLFCETMCPLGTLQSIVNRIFHPKTAVRRVCTRLPQSRPQIALRWLVLVACAALAATGFGGLAWAVAPYSIFGKAMALFVPGIAMLCIVLVLSAIGKGRIWCNWICPAGTLFSLLATRSVFCHKVGPGCANCRACFPKKPAPEPAQGGDGAAQTEGNGVTRRETLQGMAVLAAAAAAEKTTDGGYAPVSLHENPERANPVLPPGAGDASRFSKLCVGCGLCVTKCSGGCLVQSTSLKRFGQPEMDFRNGYCITGCRQKCAEVCPAGAITRLADLPRKDIHMGHAIWVKDRCIRATDGVECTACSRKCPVEAIHIVGGFPVVDHDACIGCGACEYVCPSHPQPAIFVKGFDRQRIVAPVGTNELIAEMVALVKESESVVCSTDGVISGRAKGEGIRPLFDLLDRHELRHAIVVDKVVGRAAAAICIVGGARRVHGLTMSEDAAALLAANGIEATAELMVPHILNRSRDAACPMEQAVSGSEDPFAMVANLRRTLGIPEPESDAGGRRRGRRR